MSPKPPGLVLWHQIKTRAEIKQDVCGLCDYQLTRFQKWRREWALLYRLRSKQPHHRRNTPRLPRHVNIICTGVFEGKPHKFTASLDLGPVVKLITHKHLR